MTDDDGMGAGTAEARASRWRIALAALAVLGVALACGHAVYRGDRAPPEGQRVTDGDAGAGETAERPWVVDAGRALADLDAGALLLDARAAEQYAAGHVAGAVPVPWQLFSAEGDVERGRLHPDDAVLQAAVDGLGVRGDTPVRVVGDPVLGWGEDGRIVWTLRTLGHTDVALVDGGHAALVSAGAAVDGQAVRPPTGDFVIERRDDWSIETAELRELLADGAVERGEVVLIDAREAREYAGETPYGESRGGHVPGAVHLHYRALLTAQGFLRPIEALRTILDGRGARPEVPVVVYCTGGVRSGWFVAALTALGHADVRNYPGSMWAWAAGPADAFPLETD